MASIILIITSSLVAGMKPDSIAYISATRNLTVSQGFLSQR